jgi:hypothetical protein
VLYFGRTPRRRRRRCSHCHSHHRRCCCHHRRHHPASVIARACKSQSQPPSEARAFLRDAHTHHAQIPSLGSTWIGGIAPFGRAVLELREVQRLENEDVDTLLRTSENGSENEKGSVHSNSSSSSLSKEWGTGSQEGQGTAQQSPDGVFFSCHYGVIISVVVNTMLGSERTLVGLGGVPIPTSQKYPTAYMAFASPLFAARFAHKKSRYQIVEVLSFKSRAVSRLVAR